MTTIDNVEDATRAYAAARARLAAEVEALETALAEVRRRHIGAIKTLADKAGTQQAGLRALIEQVPDLFDRPKTITVDGVKVGYRKAKGKVVVVDEAATIARIRKLLPADQAELLIRRTEAVHKPGVYDLIAADLKRLGITIEDDTDEVVIKPVGSDIDKLVDALLKSYAED